MPATRKPLTASLPAAVYRYAEYVAEAAGRSRGALSTWEVVLSGFFDSIGLYKKPDLAQERVAREWVHRFGLDDLVVPPAPGVRTIDRLTGKVRIERPRLLLLDEPTHGLQGDMRRRLLAMLSALADDPDHSIVYVSHHSDEVDALGFENVLQL